MNLQMNNSRGVVGIWRRSRSSAVPTKRLRPDFLAAATMVGEKRSGLGINVLVELVGEPSKHGHEQHKVAASLQKNTDLRGHFTPCSWPRVRCAVIAQHGRRLPERPCPSFFLNNTIKVAPTHKHTFTPIKIHTHIILSYGHLRKTKSA